MINCYRENIAKKFSDNIQKTDIGIDAGRPLKLEVEQSGIKKDLIYDQIRDLDILDLDNFEMTIRQKEKAREEQLIKSRFQNISDDSRFLDYEAVLDPSLIINEPELKKDLGRTGFYTGAGHMKRSRAVRESSNVDDYGQQVYKDAIDKYQYFGNRNVEEARKELENLPEITRYKDIKIAKAEPVPTVKRSKGVDFSAVLQEVANDQFSLYGGHGLRGSNKKNMIDYLKQANEEYNQNTTHNAGANVAGRFGGGFQRRRMIDQATNNQKPEHIFDLKENNIDIDAYYYDYGVTAKPDAVVDKLQSYDNDGKVMPLNI